MVWLKEKTLYFVFPWAYVQNFALAWAYTSGWVGKDLCQALLLSKEFLLFWLFLSFLPWLFRYGGESWLLPMRVLALFTVWCVVRYTASAVFQGQSFFGNLWNLRVACFPFEILTIAVAVAWSNPEFAKRFIRNMILPIVALAIVGIALDVLPGVGFWHEHVDFANYNVYVKGESPNAMYSEDLQAEAEGLVGNDLARSAFSSISPFRAFGTIGDAVGFGHFVAFPVLLIALWLRRSWKTWIMLVMMVMALFLSFTRSAWIFVAIGFVYVLLRKGRYRVVFALAAICLIVLLAWGPLATFYSGTLANLTANSGDPHAVGISWFYTQGLWQSKNILGQGMAADIPEGGYAVILIRYGLPAVSGLVWFCFALYRRLRESALREAPLLQIAQAVPLGVLVIMNFSYYPFNFIPYLLVWFVVGAGLAATSMANRSNRDARNKLFTNLAGTQA